MGCLNLLSFMKMARSKPCLSRASQVQTWFVNSSAVTSCHVINKFSACEVCIQVTFEKSHRIFSDNENPEFPLVLCGVYVGVVCW